jgi:hypothetical protein
MKAFYVRNMGHDMQDAFKGAQKIAKLLAGPDASIADKTSVIEVQAPDDMKPAVYAEHLVRSLNPMFSTPESPAGAIALDKPEWLFFGWA